MSVGLSMGMCVSFPNCCFFFFDCCYPFCIVSAKYLLAATVLFQSLKVSCLICSHVCLSFVVAVPGFFVFFFCQKIFIEDIKRQQQQ